MRTEPRTRPAATVLVWLAIVAIAPVLSAEEADDQPLPAELMEARTVCIMDMAVMDADLKARFRSELEDWERFEIVMFPDEADVMMSLSARSDFTSRPIEEEECDPEDPLCDRATGTAQVFEKLYLKVFVQGGDELWVDEEAVDEGDTAAKMLVERLRGRMEGDGSDEPESSNR